MSISISASCIGVFVVFATTPKSHSQICRWQVVVYEQGSAFMRSIRRWMKSLTRPCVCISIRAILAAQLIASHLCRVRKPGTYRYSFDEKSQFSFSLSCLFGVLTKLFRKEESDKLSRFVALCWIYRIGEVIPGLLWFPPFY